MGAVTGRFAHQDPGYMGLPLEAFAITPSDSADLATHVRRIWVGTAGNIKITTPAGNDVTYTNVPAGYWDRTAVRVWSTGTTASGLIGEP